MSRGKGCSESGGMSRGKVKGEEQEAERAGSVEGVEAARECKCDQWVEGVKWSIGGGSGSVRRVGSVEGVDANNGGNSA